MTVIQVNIPYSMLLQRLDFVVEKRLHPEIYFAAEDLDACRKKDIDRLSKTLQENRLEITFHGPFMDLSPGGVDRRIKEVTRDRFMKTLKLAQIFKPKMIVFHPGYERWKYDGNVELWLENSLQTWEPLVREAEKRKLTLAVENIFDETPDAIQLLLEKIHSPCFRFCFDTGHYLLFSKVPMTVWMDILGKYLGEMHLHDNHKNADEHLPPGEGDFDFRQLFTLLSRMKLNPIYTIEPHQEDHLWRSLEALNQYLFEQRSKSA